MFVRRAEKGLNFRALIKSRIFNERETRIVLRVLSSAVP